MERFGPPLKGLGLLLVIAGDTSVQVPAIVIEAHAGDQGPNIVGRLVLQEMEADYYVSDLDARIVDVILNFDLAPRGAQHPYERVAEDRVPDMTDVSRL